MRSLVSATLLTSSRALSLFAGWTGEVPPAALQSPYAASTQTAVAAVRRACEAVATVNPEAWKKDDASPVTVADFAAQAIVVSALRDAFPEDAVVAEETAAGLSECGAAEAVARVAGMSVADLTLEVPTRGRRKWVLDPVDGTRGFLRGDQYCTALALVDDGQLALSVIGAPNLRLRSSSKGCLALAVKGCGAFVLEKHEEWAWRRLRASHQDASGDLTLVQGVEGSHSNHAWADAAMRRVVGGELRRTKLDSQVKAIVLADGSADAFIRLPRPGYRENIWDVAPAALLVHEANGHFTDRRGNPIDWALPGPLLGVDVDGLLATNGLLHEPLLAALTATEPPEYSSSSSSSS